MNTERRDYLLSGLATHLFHSGEHDRLHSLFDNSAWMRAKNQFDVYYNKYLEDLEYAWLAILNAMDSKYPNFRIEKSIRYSLIQTTINSISLHFIPELVGRAIELGIWPIERGLAILDTIPDTDAKEKIKLITILLGSRNLGDEKEHRLSYMGYELIKSMYDVNDKLRTIKDFVPVATPSVKTITIEYGLSLISGIEEHKRGETLIDLSPIFEFGFLDDALTIANDLKPNEQRFTALASCTKYINDVNERNKILEEALIFDRNALKRRVFDKLPEDTSEYDKHVVEEANHQLFYEFVSLILPLLSGELADKMLSIIAEIEDARYRGKAITHIPAGLRDDQKLRALEIARGITGVGRTIALSALAKYFPEIIDSENLVDKVISDEYLYWDEEERIDVLGTITPLLSDKNRDNVLDTLFEIYFSKAGFFSRREKIRTIAPNMSFDEKKKFLDRAKVLPFYDQQRAIAEIAPVLEQELVETILFIHPWIEDFHSRIFALASIYQQVEAFRGDLMINLLVDSITRVRDTLSIGVVQYLEFVMPNAQGELQEVCQEIALDLISNNVLSTDEMIPGPRVHLDVLLFLRHLLPYLSQESIQTLKEKLMEADSRQEKFEKRIPDPFDIPRFQILHSLLMTTQNNEESNIYINNALASAQRSHSPDGRAGNLADLLPFTHGEIKDTVVKFAIQDIHQIADDKKRAEILEKLYPNIDSHKTRQELVDLWRKSVEGIQDPSEKVNRLSAYISEAGDTPKSHQLLLSSLDQIRSESRLRDVLPKVAKFLTTEEIEKLIPTIKSFEDKNYSATILGALFPFSANKQRVLDDLLEAVIQAFYQLRLQSRDRVLSFIGNSNIFTLQIFPLFMLENIVKDISEICWEWTWQ